MTQHEHNVDASEIDKFSNLAHKWWDLEGEFKPLHQINPLRLRFIMQHINLKGKNVADIGCGGGILSESLAMHAAWVLGVDMAEKSLQTAKLHALDSGFSNLAYRHIRAEDLANEMIENFDVVTCMEMIEHVPNPLAIVKACAKLVKPGGWVFLSTINRSRKAYLEAILAAEYVLKLLPKKTHDYQKFVKPSELARMARSVGLIWEGARGMGYNPLTQQYKLTNNLGVNYLFACRKM